jgi:Uma2 family endonuclease
MVGEDALAKSASPTLRSTVWPESGAATMSTAEAHKPRPRRLLDGVPPDTRVVIADVTWDVYESFVDAVREGENCHVAFDGKDIELMTVGPFHESLKSLVDTFVAIVAAELEIERQPLGQTTWMRKKVKRGVESDLCYYFDVAKLAAFAEAFVRGSNKVKDYPNPDLAIEVDVSPSKIDRPGIYAALRVPELWRVRKQSVSIEQLGPSGTFVPAVASGFLHVQSHEVSRWLFGEDSRQRVTWERSLREWVQDELGPRVNA